MLIVPLQAVPSQVVNVQLQAQATTLRVYQRFYGLNNGGIYIDVLLNNSLVIGGVQCENANRIIRNAYFGYLGDFAWIDTQGSNDPYYTGIGIRYFLAYLAQADLAQEDV